MRTFDNLGAFAFHLAALPTMMHAAQRRGERVAADSLVEHAKAMVGEDIREWPALADSTIAEKQRLGFTGRVSATDPLYRTGEYRISIGATVDQSGITLGSTDPIAPLLEHGTVKMPPRPVIGPTMFTQGHEAADRIAEHVVAAVASRDPPLHRER